MSKKWIYLLVLSLIWGSSFILIKKGLVGLNPYQLGSLRIVLTSFILFSVGFKRIGEIRTHHWKWIAISGFVSSFFPPFLFAMAQNHIDSAVVSILNSLTPLATVVVGMLAFGVVTTKRQWLGVFIGLSGTVLLILSGAELHPGQKYGYSTLILLASLGYAFNVNIIKKYLSDISALAVTTGNFLCIFLPGLAVLYVSGFFSAISDSVAMQQSALYILILSLIGTALAKVLFNKLIQVSSPVFASSVTYAIPVVALLWGVWDGEGFGWLQGVGALVVLMGVYLSHKRRIKS